MVSGFAEDRSWMKSRQIDALLVDRGDEQPQGRYIDARRTNLFAGDRPAMDGIRLE
jgi:hypothetical protein